MAIEREMGIYTNVNAYLSFSKGGAFKPHWDFMDALVVQVHGNKLWRIWNTEVPDPVEISPETLPLIRFGWYQASAQDARAWREIK